MRESATLPDPEFVKAARTIRTHLDGIAAAVNRGLANGRHEGLNKVRAMIKRAYGFHSPGATLALIMLGCGPITLELPYQRVHDAFVGDWRVTGVMR